MGGQVEARRLTRISVDGKAVEQDDTKWENSHRVLPIPDPLLVALKAAKTRPASEKLTLGTAYADLGYAMCNEAGQPYHPDTLSKMWANAGAAAGVPRIRLHDARHTCGTTMHLQGVPAAVIAAWLGHATWLSRCEPMCTPSPTRWPTARSRTRRLASSNTSRRGPLYGRDRRNSNNAAPTAAGSWCGQDIGRCDRSTSPSRPDTS